MQFCCSISIIHLRLWSHLLPLPATTPGVSISCRWGPYNFMLSGQRNSDGGLRKVRPNLLPVLFKHHPLQVSDLHFRFCVMEMVQNLCPQSESRETKDWSLCCTRTFPGALLLPLSWERASTRALTDFEVSIQLSYTVHRSKIWVKRAYDWQPPALQSAFIGHSHHAM